MDTGQSAWIDLMLELDTAEGPIYLFIAVTKVDDAPHPSMMRIDGVTAVFTAGYWQKKTSLARKRRLATMAGLKAAPGFNLHFATDGEIATVFRSAQPLQANQVCTFTVTVFLIFA